MKNKPYIVCLDGNYIRDAQIFAGAVIDDDSSDDGVCVEEEHCDPYDDPYNDDNNWIDSSPEPFIGIVYADNEEEACKIAGTLCRYNPHYLYAAEVCEENSLCKVEAIASSGDLMNALREKMVQEQHKWRDWLVSLPAEEMLCHCYEYQVREDILLAIEDLTLPDEQCTALLASPNPLSDVFKAYERRDASEYMEGLLDTVESHARTALAIRNACNRCSKD